MQLYPPDTFLVENKTQGAVPEFKLSWKKAFLATEYNIYRSYVPYGIGELVGTTSDTSFEDVAEAIEGTNVYYRIEAVRGDNALSTRYQCAQNTAEYMNFSDGTWNDTNVGVYDPHTNEYPSFKNDPSIMPGTVNFLPANVLRRYQLNTIGRHEIWILQDRGELVYFIKKKNYNYSQSSDNDARAQGSNALVEYYPPIVISVAVASPGQTHYIAKNGGLIEKQTRSWTIYTPQVMDGDIIVTRMNERFELQNTTYQRSFRGAVTWQSFDLVAKPITDPIYSNPLIKNVDGTKLYPKEDFWKVKF